MRLSLCPGGRISCSDFKPSVLGDPENPGQNTQKTQTEARSEGASILEPNNRCPCQSVPKYYKSEMAIIDAPPDLRKML